MAELDLTDAIGHCGRFQVILVAATYSAYGMVSWVLIFMVFGLYNPGWTCLDDEYNSPNYSNHSNMASSVRFFLENSEDPTSNQSSWTKDCEVKRKCKNLMYNPETSTVVTEWGLTCDMAWVSSIIISVQMAGCLVGAYLAGQFGDKLGRKFSIYISLAVHVVGQFAISFAINWQMYACFMFVIGMSTGGLLASAYHFPLEFVNSWWRGILTALPVWNVGCMIFVGAIYTLKNWRHVHRLGGAVSVIPFLTIFWTPESVRWLAVSGKVKEAKRVIAKINEMNGRKCPDTQVIEDIANEEKMKTGSHKYTYVDLFRIKEIRGFTYIFGFIWISMAISYYAISFGIKSFSGNFYLNFFIFSIADVPFVLTIAPLITILGRRNCCLLYFALASASSLSAVVVFFVASDEVKDVATVALAILCKSFLTSAWYTVKLLSGELFPTVVRSLHYGYVNAAARIGAIVSPYIISNDPQSMYATFLAIGILLLCVFGILCTVPETKGKPLQDTTKDVTVEVKLTAIIDKE